MHALLCATLASRSPVGALLSASGGGHGIVPMVLQQVPLSTGRDDEDEDFDYQPGMAEAGHMDGMEVYSDALRRMCRGEEGEPLACEQEYRARQAGAPTTTHPKNHLMLGYKHFSKCAGTYLVSLIVNMTRRNPGVLAPGFFSERRAVTKERHENKFLIGSTRNPCDYYVSLWSYQSEKPWSVKQNAAHGGNLWQPEARACQHGCPASANSDPHKFAAWVNLTVQTSPGKPNAKHGIMTYRFWDMLVKKHDTLQCWGNNLLGCAKLFDDDVVSAGMAEFDPDEDIDCWVATETFDDDVPRCLKEYERKSGFKLDWNAWRSRVPVLNKANHAPCEHFFSAKPDLGQRILERDKELARAFGYTSCCTPPRRSSQASAGSLNWTFSAPAH